MENSNFFAFTLKTSLNNSGTWFRQLCALMSPHIKDNVSFQYLLMSTSQVYLHRKERFYSWAFSAHTCHIGTRGRFHHDIPILIIDWSPKDISLEVKTLISLQLLITQGYYHPGICLYLRWMKRTLIFKIIESKYKLD